MIETKVDSYTEHFLFVEETAKPKVKVAPACLACGEDEVIRLKDVDDHDLAGENVGRTGLSLATNALAKWWFKKPGSSDNATFEMRNKSLAIDTIVLGVTSVIMLGTVTFILGWEIGLIVSIGSVIKTYVQFQTRARLQEAITHKERQRIWDRPLELAVLAKRRKVWARLGYCRECGTVHDVKKRKFTSWYNMLELYDDLKRPNLKS